MVLSWFPEHLDVFAVASKPASQCKKLRQADEEQPVGYASG
jgi:hypothetical protein